MIQSDARSMGSRDGARWFWRRDDATRVVTVFTDEGPSVRPYTTDENNEADARRAQEALRARLKAARAALGSTVTLAPAERLKRLEALVADMLDRRDDGR